VALFCLIKKLFYRGTNALLILNVCCALYCEQLLFCRVFESELQWCCSIFVVLLLYCCSVDRIFGLLYCRARRYGVRWGRTEGGDTALKQLATGYALI
jgi:hypothetical protein